MSMAQNNIAQKCINPLPGTGVTFLKDFVPSFDELKMTSINDPMSGKDLFLTNVKSAWLWNGFKMFKKSVFTSDVHFFFKNDVSEQPIDVYF